MKTSRVCVVKRLVKKSLWVKGCQSRQVWSAVGQEMELFCLSSISLCHLRIRVKAGGGGVGFCTLEQKFCHTLDKQLYVQRCNTAPDSEVVASLAAFRGTAGGKDTRLKVRSWLMVPFPLKWGFPAGCQCCARWIGIGHIFLSQQALSKGCEVWANMKPYVRDVSVYPQWPGKGESWILNLWLAVQRQ